MSPRARQSETVPIREELDALAYAYHHVHNELQTKKPGGSVRRRLEDDLQHIRERIDRILEEWVQDDELRDAWNEYLHTHGAKPDGPAAGEPLVFRGESDAGSVAEVRRAGGEYRVYVDGGLLERADADKDFSSQLPGLVFRLDGFEFRETFAASPEALDALAEFVENEGSPPWEYAGELL
ncbi:MAG TPA: hypothetical protein VGN06_04090, partial [Gaiellaceae bacterium]